MSNSSIRALSDTPVRVSCLHVRALCEGAEQAGVTLTQLAQQAGLDAGRVTEPGGWVTTEEFDRLLVSSVRLSGDHAFGLHWAERTPMLQFGQLAILVGSAPSLRAVLECAARFHPLLASRVECRFEAAGAFIRMHCDPFAVSALGIRVRTEFLLAATQRLFQYFGEEHPFTSVSVSYACPDYAEEYERLFGPNVRFGRPSSSCDFRQVALDRTRDNRDAQLHEQLRGELEEQSRRTLDQLSFTERIETAVRADLPKRPSIQQTAQQMGMSERSLRRHLAAERITWTALVDRVRAQLVEEMYESGQINTKEIAHALGYAGASPFHRAFRRWNGETPRARRLRKHLVG